MNKFQWNFNQNFNIFIQENAFESVVCEMAAMLSRPQCVKRGNEQYGVSRFIAYMGDVFVGQRENIHSLYENIHYS